VARRTTCSRRRAEQRRDRLSFRPWTAEDEQIGTGLGSYTQQLVVWLSV
jgi:hypothetical protein